MHASKLIISPPLKFDKMVNEKDMENIINKLNI